MDDLTMQEELQVLMMGQKIEVRYYEDHLAKLEFLMKFMGQYGQQLPPKAQGAIQENIDQHMNFLKVLEQAQAAMAGAGGAPGMPVAQPGRRGSPRSIQQNSPVNQSAQIHRNITRTGG